MSSLPLRSGQAHDQAADTLPEAATFDASPQAVVAERVLLLAERSRDAVGGVLLGCLLIAAVLFRHAPWPAVAIWIGVFVVVNGFRVLLSRRLLHAALPPDGRVLRYFLGFAVVNGLWLGALSLVFFEPLGIEQRLALTVLILLATAGGAATYASYVAGYVSFVALAVPPLALQWGLEGGRASGVIVVTLLVYGAMMAGFSRYLASVFQHSVHIRFQREAVVLALRAEQAQSERERQKAEQASQSKSRFLANASHDLRQPAQALALYTAVLQRSAQTDEQHEIADNIAQASRTLGELLANLLDLSRLDAGAVVAHPRPVQLRDLVERLRSEAQHLSAGSAVSVSTDCPPLVLATDPLLLERLLRNLVHNALKFTDHGRVRMTVAADAQTVRITVRDTGCGISPAHCERVFDEFFQVGNTERDRARGLGLGLSIVKRLAGLLGGTIHLDSELGAGSSFTLALPRGEVAGPMLSAAPQALVQPPRLDGTPVLVIDDDPMVLAGMLALLRSWGAEVDGVDGLAAALALQPARAWRLCLCDLRLRGGEHGLDAATSLRSGIPGLKVVLVTGDTAPDRIEMAARSGFALLHKPVAEAALAAQIVKLLSLPASGA